MSAVLFFTADYRYLFFDIISTVKLSFFYTVLFI